MLRFDEERAALGDGSRCARCTHLVGLHAEYENDYGEEIKECIVCGCYMRPIGPEPAYRPHSFHYIASVGMLR